MKEMMSNGDVLDFGHVKQYKLPKLIKYFNKYQRYIKSEKITKVDMDRVASMSLLGKGFLITNPESSDKFGNKTEDGLFSPKFGFSQFDDPSENKDSYRCRCTDGGGLSGAIFLDEICERCGHPVQFVDADLSIMAWIPLGKYVIISPAMYIHLVQLVGKTELTEILKVNSSKMTVDGNIKVNSDDKNPYHNIGMMALYERIDEIMDYYLKLHPKHKDQYNLLHEYHDCIFTHYIPVYPSILRPHISNNEKVKTFKVNTIYATMLNHYTLINAEENNMFAVLPALSEMQLEFLDLYDTILDSYIGKEGLLRGMFAGSRIDLSARSLIVQGPDLRPDEIDIPYAMATVFLELELIHLLCILDDITENEAYQIVHQAQRTYNPRIQALCQNICDKSKTPIYILANRPPSLSDRSIRLMRVRNIGTDIENLTVRIPINICPGMNADFDGDSLSFIIIKDWRLAETFKHTLSPRTNYISRTTGKYCTKMDYVKDYAIILGCLFDLNNEEDDCAL